MIHEMSSLLAPELWVSGSMVHGRSLVGAGSVHRPQPGAQAQVGRSFMGRWKPYFLERRGHKPSKLLLKFCETSLKNLTKAH